MNTDLSTPDPASSWDAIEEYRKKFGRLPPKEASEIRGYVRELAPGRNDICPCASGKKYKKCCLGKY